MRAFSLRDTNTDATVFINGFLHMFVGVANCDVSFAEVDSSATLFNSQVGLFCI